MGEKGQPALARVFSALTDFSCGGITDDPSVEKLWTQPSPLCPGWNAPFVDVRRLRIRRSALRSTLAVEGRCV